MEHSHCGPTALGICTSEIERLDTGMRGDGTPLASTVFVRQALQPCGGTHTLRLDRRRGAAASCPPGGAPARAPSAAGWAARTAPRTRPTRRPRASRPAAPARGWLGAEGWWIGLPGVARTAHGRSDLAPALGEGQGMKDPARGSIKTTPRTSLNIQASRFHFFCFFQDPPKLHKYFLDFAQILSPSLSLTRQKCRKNAVGTEGGVNHMAWCRHRARHFGFGKSTVDARGGSWTSHAKDSGGAQND